MRLVLATASHAAFGGDLSDETYACLREAATGYRNTARAEALLQQAMAARPEQLAVYYSLYKFYFYKHRLEDAERITRLALVAVAAAKRAGSDPDWRRLTADTADGPDTLGPQHFYLFSLKALAFIRLRRGDRAECRAILAKLRSIDSTDSTGASVIEALSASC